MSLTNNSEHLNGKEMALVIHTHTQLISVMNGCKNWTLNAHMIAASIH